MRDPLQTCERAGVALRSSLHVFRRVHTPYLHRYVAAYAVMVNTKWLTLWLTRGSRENQRKGCGGACSLPLPLSLPLPVEVPSLRHGDQALPGLVHELSPVVGDRGPIGMAREVVALLNVVLPMPEADLHDTRTAAPLPAQTSSLLLLLRRTRMTAVYNLRPRRGRFIGQAFFCSSTVVSSGEARGATGVKTLGPWWMPSPTIEPGRAREGEVRAMRGMATGPLAPSIWRK
jgi:hypothetical protein